MNVQQSKVAKVIQTIILTGSVVGVAPTVLGDDNRFQIEEIIVTAQKRAQNLNDVGITVTAFSAQDIKDLGLSQPQDIAAQTPNLRINNTIANSIPNISIRGIGLNDYAVNNNPAAGIYVDEVYLASPAMLSFQMFDVQRVEVLKGPQGTLYGRNTTAGAVNFVANKPSEELEGSLSAEYGRFGYTAIEGAVGGQLTQDLTGRLAIQTTQQSEGHQVNRDTGKDVGEIDRLAWRGMLSWQPSEELDVLLNVHGGRDDSDIYLIELNADTDGDSRRSGAFTTPKQDIDSDGIAVTINWDINESLQLASVTGYEELTRSHIEDRDASAAFEALDGYFSNEIDQLSQEVRLTYEQSDKLALIFGAFYSEDTIDTRDRFDATDLLALIGLAPANSIGNEYHQEGTSAALFVHSEWNLADNWTLTSGVRYTSEEKEFTDAFTFLIVGGSEVNVFAPVNLDEDFDDVSGKIALDYHGIEDTLLYASVSKGYKSGGFQGQLAFSPDTIDPFDEEVLWAFEMGSKSVLLDSTLQLNTSIFYYDYKDLQGFGTFDSPIGPLFGLTNVGDAKVTGIEVEAWFRPIQGLDLKLGLGYLDAKIVDSDVADVEKGNDLGNSPALNVNGQIKYEWRLTDGLLASVMTDFNYQDELFFDIYETPTVHEDAYWLVNARVGIKAEDESWGVFLWGKNIGDVEYRTMSQVGSVGFGDSYGMPVTYGIGANYNW